MDTYKKREVVAEMVVEGGKGCEQVRIEGEQAWVSVMTRDNTGSRE